MAETSPPIVENCPACDQPVDVSDQRPLARVICPACGAEMRARTQFGPFTLLTLLGEGGMGSVFKAMDRTLQREVALKVMKPDLGATAEDLARLATEARLTASVNHPSVVKVFSFGEDHGQFYLAMELVEKGSLDSLMELQGRVAETHALEVGIQAAEGLRAAYEVGLIHRDIKPGNILFAGPRQAKLVDFGLARIAAEEAQEAGEIWGTPFYVAPEKLDGGTEDFRSDIYSLGGTLFHAIAGRPPFDAKTASLVVLKHIKSQAVSIQAFAPNVSDATAAVINRMLHKDPDQRFGSYDELIRALGQARAGRRKDAAPAKTKRRAARPPGVPLAARHGETVTRAVWATAGGGALVALIAAAMLAGGGGRPSVPDPTAVALAGQARSALVAGQYAEAADGFREALLRADGRQPETNWLRAQRGLALLLAGDQTAADGEFRDLASAGMFRDDVAGQPVGRSFVNLAKGLLGPSAVDDGSAFARVVLGLRDWRAGDVAGGGARLAAFDRDPLPPGERWLLAYRPLLDPYLADYGRYQALREKVKQARPETAAEVVVQIEQAKGEVRTGPQMADALDALKTQLPL